MTADSRAVPLPKDASLVDLRPESLSFQSRSCLLPGTTVFFNLVMEGHALPLRLEISLTEVVDKDRAGYRYVSHVSLETLSSTDHQLIELFIKKGRGEPELTP
jgi:hypothetical protein